MRTCAHVMAMLAAFCATPAAADETDLTNKVAIELNTISQSKGNCTLTFMVTNGHPVAINQLVFETVLFGTDGTVNRLTLFDFGALPTGLPRVRQFAVPDLSCGALGRVLFNGVHTCDATGLEPAACADGLVPLSRVNVEVLG